MYKLDKPYLVSTFSNAAIGAFLAFTFTIEAPTYLLKYYFLKQTLLSIFSFILVSWPFEKTVINKTENLIYDRNSIKSILLITIGTIFFLNYISINEELVFTKLIMLISIFSGLGLSLISTIYSLKNKYFYATSILIILRIPDLYLGLFPDSFSYSYFLVQVLLFIFSIIILIRNRNKIIFSKQKTEQKRLTYLRILSIFIELLAYTLISKLNLINSTLRVTLLINTVFSSISNIITPSIIARKNNHNLNSLKSIVNFSYVFNFLIFFVILGKLEVYYSFLSIKLITYSSSLRRKKIYTLLLFFVLLSFLIRYFNSLPGNFAVALVLLTISSVMQPLTLNQLKNN